jgi:hypothetical protein
LNRYHIIEIELLLYAILEDESVEELSLNLFQMLVELKQLILVGLVLGGLGTDGLRHST